jgi:hypothetical protein
MLQNLHHYEHSVWFVNWGFHTGNFSFLCSYVWVTKSDEIQKLSLSSVGQYSELCVSIIHAKGLWFMWLWMKTKSVHILIENDSQLSRKAYVSLFEGYGLSVQWIVLNKVWRYKQGITQVCNTPFTHKHICQRTLLIQNENDKSIMQ